MAINLATYAALVRGGVGNNFAARLAGDSAITDVEKVAGLVYGGMPSKMAVPLVAGTLTAGEQVAAFEDMGCSGVDAVLLAAAGLGVPPLSAYETAVLADAPLGYWRLGEASGTTAADEVGSFPGTYNGSPTLGVVGPMTDGNTAAQFGSGKFVDMGNVLALTSATGLSMEFWYRISAAQLASSGAWAPAFTKGDSALNANAYRVAQNGTNTQFQTVVGDDNLAHNFIMSADDAWHHVVVTWGAPGDNHLRAYLDGALSSTSASAVVPAPKPNGFAVQIGGNAQQPTRHWDGLLDEVAIYQTALSGTRIAAHFAAR
jgi:hypothetical protein